MCCPFLATWTEKELPLLPPGPMEICAMLAEPLLLPSTELRKRGPWLKRNIYIYIFFFLRFPQYFAYVSRFFPLKFCMCKPSKIVFFYIFRSADGNMVNISLYGNIYLVFRGLSFSNRVHKYKSK